MGRTLRTFETDMAGVADRLRARDDDLLLERAASAPAGSPTSASDPMLTSASPDEVPRRGEAVFEYEAGPFRRYRRTVAWSGDGRHCRVEESVDWKIAVPYWAWIFEPLVRHTFRRGGPPHGTRPWYVVPGRLSPQQSSLLCTLGVFHVASGMLYALLSQLLTFIAEDLGNGTRSQQTAILAVSRVGIVLTLVVTLASDRVGRRRIAIWSYYVALAVAVVTAASMNIWMVGALQLVCRNLSIAGIIAVDTIALEELPTASRSLAASLGAMAYGLGAGLVVMTLPLTDIGESGWRLSFLMAGLLVPLVWHASRYLPESRRFTDLAARRAEDPDTTRHAAHRVRLNRLIVLGVVLFLLNVFLAPSSQLQNDYLRTERGFSGVLITVFILTTSTPGGLGVLLGGRLSETRGRRLTAVPGLLGLGIFNLLLFSTSGVPMWIGSLLAGLIGGLCVAPLGVLSGELFPTARRGGVQGMLAAIGVTGSALGLLVAGRLIDAHGYGFAFAVLTITPIVAAVMMFGIPETRGRELEELNEAAGGLGARIDEDLSVAIDPASGVPFEPGVGPHERGLSGPGPRDPASPGSP